MMIPNRRPARLLGALLVMAVQALPQLAQAQLDANAAPPPPPPPTNWVTSASLGLTLTRGNSETLLVTANVLTEKKWLQNEVRLGADGAYGEDHDTKNTESIHGFGQYNRLFTDRFYAYFKGDILHDAIAAIDYRITLSPGVGYYFIKNESTTLSGEIGPGWIYEQLDGRTHDYFVLRVAERLEHKLNDRVRVWESVEFLPQVDRWGNYIINSEVGIDTAITKKTSLKVFAVDTYDSEPAPDRKKNDLKLVAAVGYKF